MTSKLFIFIAGSFSCLIWSNLPSIYTICSILILVCITAKKYPSLACFLIGIIWMASVGHWQCSLQLSSAEFSKPVWMTGKVIGLSHQKNGTRFNVDVSNIDGKKFIFHRNIRISWQTPVWQISQGQTVRLLVKLKPAHGLANEAGLNYQQWLFSEGIQATGYVKSSDSNLLIQDVVSMRQLVLNKVMAMGLVEQKWIAALTIGYRGLLEPDDWNLVQKTGIAHLIAISGLHLALVASLSYFLMASIIGLLISRFYRLHGVNLHKYVLIACIFTTYLYSGLAGFGLPTLRAWIMLLLFTLFILLNRNVSAVRVLLMGISCFVLFFPLSLFGTSFWLSFSAVIIIGFIFWRWPVSSAGFSFRTALSSMLRIQLGLSLLMLPIVAWQFSYISFSSPFVNLIAVPVVTLLLVPLCLVAVICLLVNEQWAAVLFHVVDLILQKSIPLIEWVSDHSWMVMNISAVPLFVWLLALLAVALLFLPYGLLPKKYVLMLLAPLFSFTLIGRSEYWQVDIFDVGQGVAVLITKNNRVLIYDVGAKYPSGFNMADSVILPVLQAKGIRLVDVVFISHGDNDHAGSLAILTDKVDTSIIATNRDVCKLGYHQNWQGLSIHGLWPDEPQNYSNNNGSCVLKISDGTQSILLPGDIDKSIELRLVELYGHKLKSDILLAPHHGSNTSSSIDFINMVDPEYVVFSQGFMNRWRFPRPEVVTRYEVEAGNDIKLLSTSDTGQIRFRFKASPAIALSVATHRSDLYPYWYANMPNCCAN